MTGLNLMPRAFPIAIGALLLCLLTTLPARAQGLIRDAEIEHSLGTLARPILDAAGLSPDTVKILLINNPSLNAFVVDGAHIFLHSGLVRRLDTPEMFQAIIAHEAAHIANGHIARRTVSARNAQTATTLGVLLSGILAAAGNTQAATGFVLGSASTAERLFLAHTRDEENAADQAAVRYMARAGVNPLALADVLEIFKGQDTLSESRQDPYARTHPLTRERLRVVRGYAAALDVQSTGADDDSAYWFARARGKLDAFLGNPGRVIRRLESKEPDSITLMQRAVAYHRLSDFDRAIANMDALMRARPDDAYVSELKGQILHEARQFAAAADAYARAVSLAPKEPLILAGHGRALLALDTTADNRRALEVLERARAHDPFQPRMLRDLALAHARLGNDGMASLATAERFALIGRLKDAAIHAKRASDLLEQGSQAWNRAQDVLNAAEAAQKRR